MEGVIPNNVKTRFKINNYKIHEITVKSVDRLVGQFNSDNIIPLNPLPILNPFIRNVKIVKN